ncbi:hypothetical protein [Marilutibacter alkalisoli]|uniref:hypothetical protein n=1 Tax=Marilutibacter alkalisoli TaxID=2591633 RepID=UPI0014249AE6|nr:hypothetical protein [Lysobacter alkalisoli]
MKLSTKQAALLSAREKALVESKGPWQVKDLIAAIKRCRDLRDKQRQLVQRQSIAAARRTGQKPSAANARTADKAEIFDRALKQFEIELHKLNTESTLAARELGVNGRTVATKKATAGKKITKKPAAKKAAAKKAPAKKTSARKSAAAKTVSKKARVAVPKSLGDGASQVDSQASRRSRAKKTR